MGRFSVLFIVFGIIILPSVSIHAQRGVGGETFVLDDTHGNTLTLRYLNIPAVTGNSFYTFAPGNGSSIPGGTANGQTLWWDNTTSSWTASNFLTNTGSAISIGIGTSTPPSLFANTVDNNYGSDIRGINANALTWATNTAGHGYAASVTNEGSGAAGFDGLMVRVWDNNVGTNALDVSQGATSPSTTPTPLFTVKANGAIAIGTTSTPSLMANTADNNYGSDARGINGNALAWATTTAQHGYATSITNEGSGASGYNGLMVRVWDNNSGTSALDISQGATSASTTPTPLFNVKANGLVSIGSTGQFQVDKSGNTTTSGTMTASTGASGLVLGSGVNATTLTSTATAARAINFPNKAGTLAISGGGATLPATAATNLATTTSSTLVQMGLGSSATITPVSSGKVLITVSGTLENNTAAGSAVGFMNYGTGTAPANGAAQVGTLVGGLFEVINPSGGVIVAPFSSTALVNLSVGTTYWIDVVLKTFGTGTIFPLGVSISAIEMP